jgi:hypothetical protein
MPDNGTFCYRTLTTLRTAPARLLHGTHPALGVARIPAAHANLPEMSFEPLRRDV